MLAMKKNQKYALYACSKSKTKNRNTKFSRSAKIIAYIKSYLWWLDNMKIIDNHDNGIALIHIDLKHTVFLQWESSLPYSYVIWVIPIAQIGKFRIYWWNDDSVVYNMEIYFSNI